MKAADRASTSSKHKTEYDRAIQNFDQAIKLNPNFAAAFSNRDDANQKKGWGR